MIIVIAKRRLLQIAVITAVLLLLSIFFFVRLQPAEVPTINPIYLGNTAEKAVAFMINVDWGEDIIPPILAVFSEKEIKATFFITGRFAGKFPELVQNIAAKGHEIGNHGYSHPHPDKISLEKNQREIAETQKVFSGLNIPIVKIFAPPYGEHQPHVLAAAEASGYQTILWTVDTVDWQEPPAQAIYAKIVGKADNGVLFLMHPKKCTLTALPDAIEALKKENFTFKTVSEITQ